MARVSGDVTVTLSVLDRLIDREPDTQVEAPLTRAQSVRVLKQAVRRDLEWLLNTRRIADQPGDELPELQQSLYSYGLQDFSSYTMASVADQTKLMRQLLSTVKLFEPRLEGVRVIPVESNESGMQRLTLRIEGLLKMDPSPEPVSFDTVIELKSGVCRLSGGANAG
jgi:type VI secretion system protein ImpF